MIEFDDMELMQLKFCMDQTKNQMSMGGEIRRHASIVEKVEAEMEKRKNDTGAYTPDYVRRQVIDQINHLRSQIDGHINQLEAEI